MCNKINKETPANSGEAENVASLSQPNASRYQVGDCILLDNGEAGRLVALGTEANGEAYAQVVMFESTPNKKEVLELEGQLPICCPLSQVLSKVSIVKARSAQAAHKLLSETTELIGSNWLFCSGYKSRSGAIMPYSSCELDLNTSEDDDEEEHIASDENEDEHPASAKRPATGRNCVECGATQTPQWREGPAGPKTLCNACGVRFNRLRAKGGGSDISIRKYKAAAGAAAAKKKSNLSAVPSRPRSKKTTHTMIQAPRTSFAPIKMEEDVTLPHSSTSSQDHDMLDLSLGHDLSILAPCPMRGVLRGATLKAFGFLSNVSSPKAASAVAGGGPSSHFELCTSPSNVNAMHSNQGGISKILSEELAEALSNIERLEASGKLQLPDSALERIKDVTEQVNAATNEADAAEEALRSVTLALMQRQRAAEEAREKASAAVDRLRGFMSTLINEHRIVSTPLAATKGVIQVPSLDYYGAVGAGSAPVAPMAASAHAACLNEAVSEARDPDLLLSCWSGFGRSNALPSVQLDQDLLMFDGFGPFGGAADGSGATLLLDDGSFGQVINAQA